MFANLAVSLGRLPTRLYRFILLSQNVARLQRERSGAERARGRTQSQLEDLRASVRAAAVADDPDLDKTDEIEKLQEAVDLQRSVVR